ncbi:MAG: helix-turn-helix domain-containing protein [Planctomycetota bacterium]|jgi:excisionase family DNA binding protein
MAKSGEFYTFDEVVRQLKIDENKLKRLVSEGEISAFREGDVMKFKRTEIDKLATKGAGSETSETVLSEITLEDEAPAFEESGETLTDDLVFESSGTEDQVDLGTEAGLPTEEISSQDTFIEEAPADDEVGMTTEPIDLSADLTEEVEEEEIEEVEAPSARRAGAPARQPRRVAAAAEAPAGNPGITFALVLGAIMLFLSLVMAWRTSTNEISNDNPLAGMSKKMADLWYDKMGAKKDVTRTLEQATKPVRDAYNTTVNRGGGMEEESE